MALTLRTNGSSGVNLVTASWWNDYYNLMTGAMNDQSVYHNYRPGSATGLPALKLATDGNVDMMQGFNSAGTKVLTIDTAGDLVLDNGTNDAPNVKWNDAVNNSHSYNDQSSESWRVVGSYRGGAESALLTVNLSTGQINLPGEVAIGAVVSSHVSYLNYIGGSNVFEIGPPLGGASAQGVRFTAWDGAASHTPFAVGGTFGALTSVDNSGNYTAKGLIANTNGLSVTGGGVTVSSGGVSVTGGTTSLDNGKLTTDGNGNLSGVAGTTLPTTRAGAATSVPIYTSTTTPTSPPTGSIWVKA